ncbi:MAG: hypothetical protein ACI8UO_001680 [Verrucomicrobiales bacterium]
MASEQLLITFGDFRADNRREEGGNQSHDLDSSRNCE